MSEQATRKRREPDVPQDVEDRLLDLYVQARRVNGATPEGHPDREASVEFTALLAGLVKKGVTPLRLARILGVTKRAVTFRLARHGYRESPPSARGMAYKGRMAANATTVDQCKWGHPMTPGHPNVWVHPRTGARQCGECKRRRARESYARLKAQGAGR